MTTCTGELTFATSQTFSGLPLRSLWLALCGYSNIAVSPTIFEGRKATEIAVSEIGQPLTNAQQFG
jgi:hypothetical protein